MNQDTHAGKNAISKCSLGREVQGLECVSVGRAGFRGQNVTAKIQGKGFMAAHFA
jgi:hypothetical protein